MPKNLATAPEHGQLRNLQAELPSRWESDIANWSIFYECLESMNRPLHLRI